jgi:uncharacterized protein YndB with AHSA1/START domain
MGYTFTLSEIIPAPPAAIYDAWVNSRAHSAMTGSKATQSPRVGANVSAWDGYISGTNLELVPGKRIVQSWRTTKFTDADPDSKIAITLRPVAAGTRLILRHSNVPSGQTSYEEGGWQANYFTPMQAYFTKARPQRVSRASMPEPRSQPPRPRRAAPRDRGPAPKRRAARRQ